MRPLLMLTAVATIVGGMLSSCCGPRQDRPPVTTVAAVDLARYQGTWYELARLPNRFERGMTGVSATYTLQDDGTVIVVNRGRKPDGSQASVTGSAWLPDADQTARLRVRFFWPFWGAYWVIGLDPEYRWAVVGHPSRDYLWYLSRTPVVDAATWQALDGIARAQGYDPTQLEHVAQP